MTDRALVAKLRARIGNPDKGEVDNLALVEYLNNALIQMGDELRFRVVEENLAIALVADQMDYAIPSNVLSILWVSHNEKRLEPFGLSGLDRDGEDWRSEDAGTPTEFAVRGRRLYLHPAPDSSAVSDDGYLSWSYVGAPPEIGPGGPEGLSESDELLLIYWAALDWCVENPSEMNAARVPGYAAKKEEMLARARERWIAEGATTAKYHTPVLRPFTGGRTGGAR